MTTDFESFNQSPGGAFFETGFESRGGREVLPTGCCCIWGATCVHPTSQVQGYYELYMRCFNMHWGPKVVVPTCLRNTGPWPDWSVGIIHGYTAVPDEETAEALCLGMPEGDLIREYERVCNNTSERPSPCFPGMPSWPPHGNRWNAPCHCLSQTGSPPEDFEEQCGHVEGYCCALVSGVWELSPEGADTWQTHCTADLQQQYYANPIERVSFTDDPEDPAHPCPDDPPTGVRGYCCVTMLNGMLFQGLDLENELEENCTIEYQQAAFDELRPDGFFVVVHVEWHGPATDGCIPCVIQEGSCCLAEAEVPTDPRITLPGTCIMGMREEECTTLGSRWAYTPGMDACTRCWDPEPPDPNWLGPEGRCCTWFEFHDGSEDPWLEHGNCRPVASSRECGEWREQYDNNPERYRNVGQSFTPGYQCLIDDNHEGIQPLWGCQSEQGWCCPGNWTSGDGIWSTRQWCEASNIDGTFYSPGTRPESLCAAKQPCCLANDDGHVQCQMLPPTECQRRGGRVMGDADTTCSDVDCEAGACCLGCSRCVDNIPPWECVNRLGGQYRGDRTRCHEIDDCPEEPL